MGGYTYQLPTEAAPAEEARDTVERTSGMARPRQVKTALGGTLSSASGQYAYDGAGNITEIGTRSYLYDRLNRLGFGEAENSLDQLVTYDTVGNITSLKTNGVNQATATSTSTNRLTGMGAAYDAGGNLTAIQIGGQQQAFGYDALNLMRSMTTSSDIARTFVYDAFDERLATLECVPPDTCVSNPARDVWTIRGLDGKVLRTYEHLWKGDVWNWQRDYVYRDGVPMASVEPNGSGGERTLHLHTDHLGSIREITDSSGSRVAYHSYYPFGGEAVSTGSDEVTLKFTGPERDESGGVALDYMHARYCSPVTGRFLGVDPANSARANRPQSWNRYSYSLNRPLGVVDPNGREPVTISTGAAAASAVVATVVVVHVVRMQTDSGYRAAIIEGTTSLKNEIRDALAPLAALASRMLDDETEGELPGSPETGRENRDRGRIRTAQDALDQLTGITGAQERFREGEPGVIVDSKTKSERRVDNFLDRIRTLGDALADFGEDELYDDVDDSEGDDGP